MQAELRSANARAASLAREIERAQSEAEASEAAARAARLEVQSLEALRTKEAKSRQRAMRSMRAARLDPDTVTFAKEALAASGALVEAPADVPPASSVPPPTTPTPSATSMADTPTPAAAPTAAIPARASASAPTPKPIDSPSIAAQAAVPTSPAGEVKAKEATGRMDGVEAADEAPSTQAAPTSAAPTHPTANPLAAPAVRAQRPAAAAPKAAIAARAANAARATKIVQKPARPPLTFVVSKLPQHVSPSRLLAEFPTALAVEAQFSRKSGERTALILTFPSEWPPPSRSSAALGCVLQAVVSPPIALDATTRRVLWRRESNGAARPDTERAAAIPAAVRGDSMMP